MNKDKPSIGTGSTEGANSQSWETFLKHSAHLKLQCGIELGLQRFACLKVLYTYSKGEKFLVYIH